MPVHPIADDVNLLDLAAPGGRTWRPIAMNTERYLTREDAALLDKHAERLLRLRDVRFNHGEELVGILSGATVLPENVRREDCVSIHSEVTYSQLAKLDTHSIEIVYPQEANQVFGRVSVLSPIGLALIGRKVSSVVEVNLPSGRVQLLTILAVNRKPEATGKLPLCAPSVTRRAPTSRPGFARY